MSQAYNITRYDEVRGEEYRPFSGMLVRSEDCTCADCKHWDWERKFSVRKDANSSATIEMAQCMCAGKDDSAPYAEVYGPREAVVMTSPDSRCPAWEVHPKSELAEVLS